MIPSAIPRSLRPSIAAWGTCCFKSIKVLPLLVMALSLSNLQTTPCLAESVTTNQDGAPFVTQTDTQNPTINLAFVGPNQKFLIPDIPQGDIRGYYSDNVGVVGVKVKLVRRRNGVAQFWNGSQFTTTNATVAADMNSDSPQGHWGLRTKAPTENQLDVGVYEISALVTDTSGNIGVARNSFTLFETPTSNLLTWGNNELLPTDMSQRGVLFGKTVGKIFAGPDHRGALCTDGSVVTWGANYHGQLGNGTNTRLDVPVEITNNGALKGKTVTQLVMGGLHSLALCSDGSLIAWGNNYYGQLGNGTTTNHFLPVVTEGGAMSGKTITKIAAGGLHSVALCSDGSVVTWGHNREGQLGDGTTAPRAAPVLISGRGSLFGKTVTDVVAGGYTTFALCSDGTVVVWGDNSKGQLGDGSTTDRLRPISIAGKAALNGRKVTQLAAGEAHTVALCSDGTVVAWGDNGSGQLGDGTSTNRSLPRIITGYGDLKNKTVTEIAASYAHSVALCEGGVVLRWGANGAGQLGLGPWSGSNRTVPINIAGKGALRINTVSQIAAGGSVTLALATFNEAPSVAITSLIVGQTIALSSFTGDVIGATIAGDAMDNKKVTAVNVKLVRTRGGVNQFWNGTSFTPSSAIVPADMWEPSSSVRWRLSTKAPTQSQLDAGEYQVIVYAVDSDSHIATTRTKFTLTVPDVSEPSVSIDTPAENEVCRIADIASGATLISGTAQDDVGVTYVAVRLTRQRGGVTQYWNGNQFVSSESFIGATLSGPPAQKLWEFKFQLPAEADLDEGVYTIHATAYDAAGNRQFSAGRSITLTATAPSSAPASETGVAASGGRS